MLNSRFASEQAFYKRAERTSSTKYDHSAKIQLRRQQTDLLEQIIKDDQSAATWGSGAMSAAVYDTAWVAMVYKPYSAQTDKRKLAFPLSLRWLLAHQNSDGSWAGPGDYAILPTLAALLAIMKVPATEPLFRADCLQTAATRAVAYLKKTLAHWSVATHESVGFEVLAPKLLEQLEKLGITFDFPDKAALLQLYEHKLRLAGPQLIYSGQSNLIHSLEAFGADLDFSRLKPWQAANGGYGSSPAATAAILIYGEEWDEAAWGWLNHLYLHSASFGGEVGAMPNAYPIDAFEQAWVLYNLAQSADLKTQFPSPMLNQITDQLGRSLPPSGASISRVVGMPTDSDDTGMVIAALNLVGVNAPLDSLWRFEREDFFVCFDGERGASTSANSHVLAAIAAFAANPNQTISQIEQEELTTRVNKLVKYLLGEVNEDKPYWTDKWHISPFYATSQALLAVTAAIKAGFNLSFPGVELRRKLYNSLRWLIQTQSQSDGGWGVSKQGSTAEETAYALLTIQALCSFTPISLQMQSQTAIKAGLSYLNERLNAEESEGWPSFWRGKELYLPQRVVESVVLAALGIRLELHFEQE